MGLRVDVGELAAVDQGHQDGRRAAGVGAAGEQLLFAARDDGAQPALGCNVVDVEAAAGRRPVLAHEGDRLPDRAVGESTVGSTASVQRWKSARTGVACARRRTLRSGSESPFARASFAQRRPMTARASSDRSRSHPCAPK